MYKDKEGSYDTKCNKQGLELLALRINQWLSLTWLVHQYFEHHLTITLPKSFFLPHVPCSSRLGASAAKQCNFCSGGCLCLLKEF